MNTRNKIYLFGFISLFFWSCSSHRNFFTHRVFANQLIAQYNIIFFVSSDCPLCNYYAPLIQNLPDSLSSHWKVFVIRTDTQMNDGFKPGFWGLETGDTMGKLAEYFEVAVTPIVKIVDKNSQILYSGAIDNYSWALGKHRVKTTAFYLQDAINQLNSNEKIRIPFTEPIGCYIE